MATYLCHDGTEFQAALDVVVADDIIDLDYTATYIEGNFVVKNRGVIAAGHEIRIRSNAAAGNLPEVGHRVQESHTPYLATIRQTWSYAARSVPPMIFEASANGYILECLEVLPNIVGWQSQILVGATDSSQTTYAQQPYHITFDRCIIRGDPLAGQKFGIQFHCKDLTIKNCRFVGHGSHVQDSVPLSGINGQGPITIENNSIQCSTYGFITGGGDPTIFTATTVSASPAPTAIGATVGSIDKLTVGDRITFLYTSGGVAQRAYPIVTNIDSGTKRLTWADTGVVPDVPGDIRWGVNYQNITIRRNHFYRPANYLSEAVIPAAPVFDAPTITPGSGLAAGTYFYRISSGAVANMDEYAYSPLGPELEVVLGATSTVGLSWSATAGTAFLVYRYQKDGGGTRQNPYFYLLYTDLFYTDDGSGGSWFTDFWYPLGSKWRVKNVFELKQGLHVQFDSNYIENSWRGVYDQTELALDNGAAIWLKTNNQDGGNEYAETADVVIENNFWANLEGVISVSGRRASNEIAAEMPAPLHGLTFRNNLAILSGDHYPPSNVSGVAFGVITNGSYDIAYDHNTFLHRSHGFILFEAPTFKGPLSDIRLTNNLAFHNDYGIFGSEGWGKAMLDVAIPGLDYDYNRNALGGANPAHYQWPGKTNYSPTNETLEAQFRNYGGTAIEDYRLKQIGNGDDLDSIYLGAGTDGKDLGVDIDALLAALTGVLAGDPEAFTEGYTVSRAEALRVIDTVTPRLNLLRATVTEALHLNDGTLTISPSNPADFTLGLGQALMPCRFGVARFGATRFGYYTAQTLVSISGDEVTSLVMPDSVRIAKYLNDEVDTARFTVIPNTRITPSPGQAVVIGAGSLDNPEFGGQILDVDHRRIVTTDGETVFYDVSCTDWSRQLDRRAVTRAWLSTSVTQIVVDVLADFTSGFTADVQGGLAVLEYFPATNAKPSEVLRRLAQYVGGGFYVDPQKVVHFWGGAYEPLQSTPVALSLTSGLLRSFRHAVSDSQIRTRVIVDGMSTRVAAPLDAGATVIPVDDASMFNAAGGAAVVDQEVVTYTGTADGGPGSLVGPGIAPPSAPTATPGAGSGLETGYHEWAYTWVTAAGETLLSPRVAAVVGPIAAPVTTPALAATAGSELGLGTYLYAITFLVDAGETTPGPVAAVVTVDGIAPPSSVPDALASWFPQDGHVGGRYNAGDAVWCRCSFVDYAGNETGGTDSNTVIAVPWPYGTAGTILFRNLPIPSDPNVVLKRLYLHVNANFVAYKELAVSRSTEQWYDAGTSIGGFPIGGAPVRRRVALSGIPLGPAGTTARRIYRTTVNGALLKLADSLWDNTTTGYLDAQADGALSDAVPTSNTTLFNQVAVAGIAVGPTGVTARNLYRIYQGEATLKFLATLADNATTVYLDTVPNASRGADAPTDDTSALTQEQGQINAGSDTLLVAGPSAFSAAGGWALVQGMFIRYTGLSGSSLIGIPASGVGALTATVNYGATILEAPRLIGVPASGAGSLTHAVTAGAALSLRVTRDDLTAQAIVAATEGGDGVYEYPIVDHRLSEAGAIARADAELETFARALLSVEWTTTDLNAQPGRAQAVTIVGAHPVAATLPILRVDLTYPVPDRHPTRRCVAALVKAPSFVDILIADER